jgi:hypothetical protein
MTRVGCFLAIALTTATVLTAWAQVPNLTDLLDTYHKGGYEEAVRRAAAIEDLGPLRLRFVQEVPVWIRAEPAQIEQRRAAAAAFLLELTHARLETDWGRLADLIEFTCADLRAGQPSKAFELAWHRA